MNFKHSVIVLSFLLLCGCQQKDDSTFLISTSYGDMKITLYDDTPEHKRNFNKLVKDGVYRDLLFHNIQQNYVIEGGNPASRGVRPNRIIGENPLTGTVTDEITTNHFHKRGAIGMRKGAYSEFYIVVGERISPEQLAQYEREQFFKRGSAVIEKLFIQNKDTLSALEKSGDSIALLRFQEYLIAQAKTEMDNGNAPAYGEERATLYEQYGGLPQLDGESTVFGEVTEGLDVLEKIANAETQPNGRPKENIVFTIK